MQSHQHGVDGIQTFGVHWSGSADNALRISRTANGNIHSVFITYEIFIQWMLCTLVSCELHRPPTNWFSKWTPLCCYENCMKAFPSVKTFREHLPCTRVNMCGHIKTANKHRSCDTNAVPVPATAVPNVDVHRLPLCGRWFDGRQCYNPCREI